MVSINFRPLVYFKSWQNRLRVDDYVLIDGFGYYFRVPWGCMKQRSVWWRFCALQKWQKRFVCSGLGLKIFIINAIDQGVLAASKPLAVNNVPIWTTLMACSPDADHWRNSHHILHVWRNQGNSKTRLVHQRYLHEVLYHIYGGGGGKFVPSSPHHTNVNKFFATLRSCSILASFQQMTFKFGDILI